MRNGQTNPLKILCVEDNSDVREVLIFILEMLGYKVTTANNGKLGVEAAKRWQPDIILMDVRMPVMNGIEAVRALRNDSATKNIPIFMVSAYTDAATRDRCLGAGADKFLTKPLSIDTLELVISRVAKRNGR